jgi:hypothetical protein
MTSIQALIGFSQHDAAPVAPGETAVPGYPDNRVMPLLCAIEDARERPAISLDEEGFTLVRHETAFADERDLEVLRRGYHDEMAEFLTGYLDAALVVPARAGILLRDGRRLIGRTPFDGDLDVIDDRIPASFAHVDYLLPDAVIAQARLECAFEGHEDIPHKRMVILQSWRSVSPPPQDIPLALCDCRTVAEADVSPRTGVLAPQNRNGLPSPTFTVGGIHHNPRQHWYYYPSMSPDEVILLTGFDTARPARGRVAHAAFDNRANQPDAHPRESIEARFYVYYD